MSSSARLGAFIVAALLALGILVFMVGDKQFVFSRTYRLNAPFDNVAGLEEGAPVRAGGVRIGTVQSIKLPAEPEGKVTVVMDLEHSTREVIKRDSVASIETEGLLGSKFVSLSFGSKQAEDVHEGDALETRPVMEYADVARKASDMFDSAKEAIDSSKTAISNVNDASGDLKSITAKIDESRGTIGALVNDRALYQKLNDTVDQAKQGASALNEDMEALKHNFFLRGFFKKRGYFDSSALSKNALGRLPPQKPAQSFVMDGNALFKSDSAKLRNEKLLNQVGHYLEQNQFGMAAVAAYTGATGEKEKNRTLTQARAMVVRKYLADKFKLDDSRIRIIGMGEQQNSGTANANRVEVLIYPASPESRIASKK